MGWLCGGRYAIRKWFWELSGAILIVSLVMMASFGRSFLPPFNEGSFTVSISTLPGISLEESDKIGRMAEDILLSRYRRYRL